MNARIFIFILLLSLSMAYAQYCPSPETFSEDKSYDLHLNNEEQEVWVKFNKNPEELRLRAESPHPFTSQRAKRQFETLERIFARVESAKDQNKLGIARMLKDDCKNVRPTGGFRGECVGQLLLMPAVREEVTFLPEGVFAAVLKVETFGEGQCSYIPHGISAPPAQVVPLPAPVVEKGPKVDCNNLPYDILFAREYVSYYNSRSSPFRVYYYQGYEIICAFDGKSWQLFKKAEYQAPSAPPALTGGATSVGVIKVLKKLPEGYYSGVIARFDGKSPTRIPFKVKSNNLRNEQKIRFTVNRFTGMAYLLEPIN